MNSVFQFGRAWMTAALFSAMMAFPGLALTKEAPIQVEADHMTSTEKTNSVLFTGSVDARQDDVRILSDEMTVFYTAKDTKAEPAKAQTKDAGKSAPKDMAKPANQKVEKLVCIGNVEITRGEWLGTSKKMMYLAKERQIHLIGNAKAWQGQNMVSGDKIIYYLDEKRSEVVAGPASGTASTSPTKDDKKPGRVSATILQK